MSPYQIFHSRIIHSLVHSKEKKGIIEPKEMGEKAVRRVNGQCETQQTEAADPMPALIE